MLHEGSDLTVVSCSEPVNTCLRVAAEFEKDGIGIEVIDLQSIRPLDREAIIRSVKKTGRLLLVDEGYTSFGITGEIALSNRPDVFYDLDAPIMRLCSPDVPVPFSPALEKLIIPDENRIRDAIRKML